MKTVQYDPGNVYYKCPVCGRYEFTESEMIKPKLSLSKLGSYLFYNRFLSKGNTTEYRYHTTLGKELCDTYTAEFNKGNINNGRPVHMDNDIINAWYPKSFSEKIDMILLKLDEMSDYVGQEVIISKQELFGLTFVERGKDHNGNELNENDMINQAFFYTKYLRESGYINGGSTINGDQMGGIIITAEGYQRIDQLQRYSAEGRNAFVAMQFGNGTMILREAIKGGIKEAGYNPILIDEIEHNELITPELLSYIRKSRFVVVDLTHRNNGAYFEEGYAMGLGKTVIQLCKKVVKLHFDIAQKNTIFWESEADIPLRLKNRINATID